MNRKDYTKPTMKVVKLRHIGMLMTSDPTEKQGQKEQYESLEW